MKHRFKSIDGAVKKIRRLESLLAWYKQECEAMNKERKLLARLASEEPQFFNPVSLTEVKKLRDRILSQTNK